jgi:hypothetical protein
MPAGDKPGWMLPCRPAWAALVLLALLAPSTAQAFSTREEPLHLAYDREATPVVIAMGQVQVKGELRGGYLAADVRDLALRAVPTLTVTERGEGALPRNDTYRGVDLVMHGGTILWTFGARDRLDVTLDAPYAIGLALPRIPLAADVDAGAGVVLASPALDAALSWSGSEGRLVLLDAEVSLLDAGGLPLKGWDRRAVNPGAGPTADPSRLRTLVTVSGAFEGSSDARIQGGALGASQDLSLAVGPSQEERFSETLDVLSSAAGLLGEDAASAFGRDSPVRQLAGFSRVLDGGLLVLGDTPGADGAAVAPAESRLGDAPFEVGPLALVRGDPMSLAWDGEQMAVQGTPIVAISGAGFAVDEPATLGGLVPVVAVVLWAVALAAIVVYLVKRPKGDETSWPPRILSMAVHVLALVAVFWWWDASFAETFGTSVLTLLRDGAAFSDPARLGILFSLEMAPWGLAALLFALPVRIVLGVALRYLGKGKSYKGVAKAGGLVALGLLGPVYALWILNVVIAEAVRNLPGLLG